MNPRESIVFAPQFSGVYCVVQSSNGDVFQKSAFCFGDGSEQRFPSAFRSCRGQKRKHEIMNDFSVTLKKLVDQKQESPVFSNCDGDDSGECKDEYYSGNDEQELLAETRRGHDQKKRVFSFIAYKQREKKAVLSTPLKVKEEHQRNAAAGQGPTRDTNITVGRRPTLNKPTLNKPTLKKTEVLPWMIHSTTRGGTLESLQSIAEKGALAVISVMAPEQETAVPKKSWWHYRQSKGTQLDL